MNNKDCQPTLSAPFPRQEIEFRISRISAKNKKACVLAYITARGIMQRLDEVFGIAGWKDQYEVLPTGVKCCLSVKIEDTWITKEDVAPFTNIEALKGAFSDSLKRAGVKFGIGRYLYDLSESWVPILDDKPKDSLLPVHYYSGEGLTGWWVEPQLPEWALPDAQAKLEPEYQNLLNQLQESGHLTKTKYGYYRQSLSDPKLSETKKALIWEQLLLIKTWGETIASSKTISLEQKKESYRSILDSNSHNLEEVRGRLKELGSSSKKGEAA